MEKVLEHAKPLEVRAYEEQEGLVWGTFLPYFRLLYLPNSPRKCSSSTAAKIQVSSVNLLLHILLNTLGRMVHIEMLVKEGLLPFMICLPSHVLPTCRETARLVVSEVSSHLQLQPPNLGMLARAKLAKMHFGLDKIISLTSAAELMVEVFPCL